MKQYLFTLFCFIILQANLIAQDQTWLLGEGRKTTSYNDYEHTVIDFKRNNYEYPPFIKEWNKDRYARFNLGALGSNNNVVSDEFGNLILGYDGILLNYLPYKDTAILDSKTQIYLSYYSLERTKLSGNTNPYRRQTSILFPHDHKKKHYNLLFLDTIPTDKDKRLYYSLIDANDPYLSSTQKQLIEIKKEIIKGDFQRGGLMLCKHGNGRDWWLLLSTLDSENRISFYRLLIDSAGINLKGIQATGYKSLIKKYPPLGQESFEVLYSPDGNYMMRYRTPYNGKIYFELFPFDRCKGEVDVNKVIQFKFENENFTHYGGAAFSPDSKKLYLSTGKNLIQYDMLTKDTILLAEKETPLGNCKYGDCTLHSLKLAPDGRIYMITDKMAHLGVIFNPNEKGLACHFSEDTLKLPSKLNGISIPNHPNYRLGKAACYTSDIETKQPSSIKIYPNPSNGLIIIELQESSVFEGDNIEVCFYDILGKKMVERSLTKTIQIDASYWNNGTYNYILKKGQQIIKQGKWIKIE